MAGYNIAELWELAANKRGSAPAQRHGELTVTWAEFDRRANGLARFLLDSGLGPDDKVAQYLTNCPEYLQAIYGSFKASMVPVNTNYRYTGAELAYLWRNADAAAVVFHGSFTETIESMRHEVADVRVWLWVDDGSTPCPEWATDFEAATTISIDGPVVSDRGRDGSDLWFLYTGGTTGQPKGVMWEQDTITRLMSSVWPTPVSPEATLEDLAANIVDPAPVLLPAAPFMHGSGQMSAMSQLCLGGCVVTIPSSRFDPHAVLDAIDREGVTFVVIVGDAMGLPLVEALDAEPDRWYLLSLQTVLSSGAMWSAQVKNRLLARHPSLQLIDGLGSSEGTGGAFQVSTGGSDTGTARFALSDIGVVLGDDGKPVEPGSGNVGRLGVSGLLPIGYYNDPVKTAEVFTEIDGVRYSLPGDMAMLEADGTLILLGRGTQCINTGGEKVFPEEVEESLKTHASVRDAAVVGVPDERFGETIFALVEIEASSELDVDALQSHVKKKLAGYKTPRRIIAVDSLDRAPNGKLDYVELKQRAADQT